MPKLDGILETAIHTKDMVRARASTRAYSGWSRFIATTDCLLMRWPDAMSSWSFASAPRDRPLSCPAGPFLVTVVMARCVWRFAIGRRTGSWETHLASREVAIEGRNDWERGGRSLYFPRSGRSPFGTGNAGTVVDLLGPRASRAHRPGSTSNLDVRSYRKKQDIEGLELGNVC